MPIRVLFVTTTYPLTPGDAIPGFVADLARTLVREQGVRVKVLAPHHPGAAKEETVDGVGIERFQYALDAADQCLAYGSGIPDNLRKLPGARWQVPGFLAAMAAGVWRNLGDVDLIHAHWVEPAFVASLANLAHRKPLVVSVHSLKPRANWLHRRTLAGADCVLFNSEYTMGRAAAMGYRCGGQVVYQGYDESLFGATVRTGRMRAALGIPPDARVVAAVGRMIEVKGMHVLAAAAERILAERADVHLVLAGDGVMREEVGAIVTRVSRPCESLGTESADRSTLMRSGTGGTPVSRVSRVHLPGALPREQVAELLAEADLLVNPGVVDRQGRAEGLGITTIEAMASGLAVVGSRVGGIAETILDGETGVLVSPGDVMALAEAVGALLDDAPRRRAMGRRGQEVARRRFGWSSLAEQVSGVYRQLTLFPATSTLRSP